MSAPISSPRTWNNKTPRGYSQGYQQQMTPEQMNLLQQNIQMMGPDSYLAKIAGGDQSMFEEMEAPAWAQFQQAQGQMASRFSGMGGMGAQKSSGFRNSMGQLGSDFAQQLQSKRMDYRNQAIKDLMGYSSDLLGQRPYEQYVAEKGPSKFERAMNIATPLIQSGVSAFAGRGGA